jgi:hypothetical protein
MKLSEQLLCVVFGLLLACVPSYGSPQAADRIFQNGREHWREGTGHLRALRVGETWREMSKPTGGAEIWLRMALKVWRCAVITAQVAP